MEKRYIKRRAEVERDLCVACGCCVKACFLSAVSVYKGSYALVDAGKCVGCGRCVKECPASVIQLTEVEQ